MEAHSATELSPSELQVQAYNPRDQEWSVETPLTSARHKSCAVAMDGDAVVLTGGTGLGVGKVN